MISATDQMQRAFLEALLKGNRLQSSSIALSMASNPEEIKALYENVVKPAMYQIGQLWENGEISVASEHLASAIVEGVLNELYAGLVSGKRSGRVAVTACVEDEKHQIGIKMVSDVFEMHGWNVFFLGADTPCEELLRFLHTVKADVLALSLSIYFHLPMLEKMLQRIRQEFPALPVLVGGQAFRYGGLDVLDQYNGVDFAGNLQDLDNWLLQKGETHG